MSRNNNSLWALLVGALSGVATWAAYVWIVPPKENYLFLEKTSIEECLFLMIPGTIFGLLSSILLLRITKQFSLWRFLLWVTGSSLSFLTGHSIAVSDLAAYSGYISITVGGFVGGIIVLLFFHLAIKNIDPSESFKSMFVVTSIIPLFFMIIFANADVGNVLESPLTLALFVPWQTSILYLLVLHLNPKTHDTSRTN